MRKREIYLFVEDPHVIRDVGEDGWLEEETVTVHLTATDTQLGPLADTTLHQVSDLVHLLHTHLYNQVTPRREHK